MSKKPFPPLLEPYLALPPETSLILLTSTLGCSINWLTARFIAARLCPPSSANDEEDNGHGKGKQSAVLFVSWIRDERFWKTEVRRATNLNLSTASNFKFLDLLTPSPVSLQETLRKLTAEIENFASTLSQDQNESRRVTLILDSPDLLLATSVSSPSSPSLSNMILHLRSSPLIHDTIISISADLPFLSAAHLSLEDTPATCTPLEIATADFAVSQAHAARIVMGTGELETGAARDVSGVLRVTRGGGWYDDVDAEENGQGMVVEREVLYLVQRDGGVKVFGRGEGGG